MHLNDHRVDLFLNSSEYRCYVKKKLNQIQQKFGKFLGINELKIEISLKSCCVVHYCLIVDTCVQFQSLGSDFRD